MWFKCRVPAWPKSLHSNLYHQNDNNNKQMVPSFTQKSGVWTGGQEPPACPSSGSAVPLRLALVPTPALSPLPTIWQGCKKRAPKHWGAAELWFRGAWSGPPHHYLVAVLTMGLRVHGVPPTHQDALPGIPG
jgi:hypothetical protein